MEADRVRRAPPSLDTGRDKIVLMTPEQEEETLKRLTEIARGMQKLNLVDRRLRVGYRLSYLVSMFAGASLMASIIRIWYGIPPVFVNVPLGIEFLLLIPYTITHVRNKRQFKELTRVPTDSTERN
jgi:hypothetical protein